MKKKTKVGIGVATAIGSAAAIAGGLFAAKHSYEKDGKESKKVKDIAVDYLSQEGPVSDVIVSTTENGYDVTAKVKKGNRNYTKNILISKDFKIVE